MYVLSLGPCFGIAPTCGSSGASSAYDAQAMPICPTCSKRGAQACLKAKPHPRQQGELDIQCHHLLQANGASFLHRNLAKSLLQEGHHVVELVHFAQVSGEMLGRVAAAGSDLEAAGVGGRRRRANPGMLIHRERANPVWVRELTSKKPGITCTFPTWMLRAFGTKNKMGGPWGLRGSAWG